MLISAKDKEKLLEFFMFFKIWKEIDKSRDLNKLELYIYSISIYKLRELKYLQVLILYSHLIIAQLFR